MLPLAKSPDGPSHAICTRFSIGVFQLGSGRLVMVTIKGLPLMGTFDGYAKIRSDLQSKE